MRVITAVELTEIDISTEGIILSDGNVNIYPEARKYFDFDFKPKVEKIKIIAGGKIGLIPLNGDVCIDIRPKFNISSLLYIIQRSNLRIDGIEFINRSYFAENTASGNIFEFICSSFCKAFEGLLNEGMLKKYNRAVQLTSSPRGKILLKNTITTCWSRSNYTNVVVEYFFDDKDIAFNKLIKLALWYCIGLFNKNSNLDSNIKERLIFFYSYFENVSLDFRFFHIESEYFQDELKRIPSNRSYYSSLVNIAVMLLNGSGISFNNENGTVRLNSFSINLANVFESYVLSVLKESKTLSSLGVKVEDGNSEGKKPLFIDRPNPPAMPDYILTAGENILIIDAKYKVASKDADRYQIISHALSYGAKNAILLMPASEHSKKGLVEFGTIGGSVKIKVYEYYFDLGDLNLIAVEESFIGAMCAFFSNSDI
jgi:5-methylcytosine-specific restriction enzyme subunit McrC